MLGRTAGLAHLTRHQLRECVSNHTHRVGSEQRNQPRRRGEQVVTGEDRDVVAPPGIGAGRPAPHLGLVHHIVVIQRGQVDQLDDGPGDRDLRIIRPRAQRRREHGKQRAEAFSTGLEQMLDGLGHELIGFAQLVRHQLFDPGDVVPDVGGECRVPEINARHHSRWCPHSSNILGAMDNKADVVVVGAGPAVTCW
ncbi:hypothetical protein BN970_01642 [Mycolicibacterium conceptionense]|uniref:Uncharacterized protein n=1 Tax=Mycolicibacterium conceptionense TaxID=451644 RepID=A0A0U1D584_9MYCO|nr:hypothetical protein BN970_01642 [Mycolicibacterium conceptionense]